MKRVFVIMAALVFSLSSMTSAGGEKKAAKEELKTSSEKLSYALGLEIGSSLKEIQPKIDLTIFARGVGDILEGKDLLLTSQQVAEVKKDFLKKMQEERARQGKVLAEKNRKEGEAFLSGNKKKKKVITTASGLQYIVLREGDGPVPKATDRVKVNYRGTLIDGTEFDSSYKRGQPAAFPVKGVIPGWTEALQLMKVGSKYRLFIPANLAYGTRGAGRQIGPDATLIFEIELLEIEK